MPMPMAETLTTSVAPCSRAIADRRFGRLPGSPSRVRNSAAGTVKVRSVVVASSETTWMIMSTLMLASASGTKIAAATPGLSATRRSVICASSLRIGDAGDDLLFHDILLVADERAGLGIGRIVEGRAHERLDLVHHGELDRAHLQHLGAERSHLQHFLEGDAVEPARLGHDARIGRIDAVDVGVDVAAVGADGGRDRHRARVRAAAAQRRHAGRVSSWMPWKPATTATCPLGETRRRSRRRRSHRCAPSHARRRSRSGSASPARSAPECRCSCSTMASSPEVTCSPEATTASYSRASWSAEASLHQADELVGLARHGRDDDRHLVAGVDLALDVARRHCGCARHWRRTCRRISSRDGP